MKSQTKIVLGVTLILSILFGSVALAQSVTPDVQVAGAGIVDGTVTIVRATVTAPAWIVIHADADGKPGPVIGHAALSEGVNTDVVVEIDTDAATPVMHAMLHVDEGVEGVYEFPGPDGPLTIGDNIVMAQFSAEPVVAAEQAPAQAQATIPLPPSGGGTSTPTILFVVALVLLLLAGSVALSRRRSTT